MATIYTRATKGSALTWTEGDANITNLNTDKIEAVVEDTTPQLGGDLDVNGNSIVSVSNGNIAITPNGTGSIVLDGLNWPQADGTANYVLKTNGSGQLSWTAMSGGGGDVVSDTTPQLGGSLDVNGNSIVSTSNGDIVLQPDGTGDVQLNADTVRVGDLNSAAKITTNGTGTLDIAPTGQLTLMPGNSFADNPYLTVATGANGSIAIIPRGTGQTTIRNLEYNEYIHSLGTTGGTIAPNVANGNVQTITLSSALTINAFTSPVAGQSLTLIINGGTAYTSITSTMKFAGGIKTLTGTAGCIDILSVFYDGTNYYASLGKGIA